LDNNIRMDLRERGWCGMDWIDLAQDMDQWRALDGNKPFWFHKMVGNS
jgi:hypothetical protein